MITWPSTKPLCIVPSSQEVDLSTNDLSMLDPDDVLAGAIVKAYIEVKTGYNGY